MTRRQWLVAAAAAGVVGLGGSEGWAMDRKRIGGVLHVTLPYALRFDPYGLEDPSAALVLPAIATPVMRSTRSGTPYPSVCEDLPSQHRGVSWIKLRAGLRSATGRPVRGRDLVTSVVMAKHRGGKLILRRVAVPNVNATDPLVVEFPNTTPAELARALASWAVPLMHHGSQHGGLDGTGGMKVASGLGRLGAAPKKIELVRNRFAVRGPSFLDRVTIRRAESLAEALRAFEAKLSDVGWLAGGLHQMRPGSRSFEGGTIGWIVLSPGRNAGSWGRIGKTQSLLDSIEPGRMDFLGLGIPQRIARPHFNWDAGPGAIVVREDEPHLRYVATFLARVLSQPGSPLRVTPVAASRWKRTVQAKNYAFALRFVRRTGPKRRDMILALATADGQLSDSIEPFRGASAQAVARSLRLGVVGSLRAQMVVAPQIIPAVLPEGFGWDFSQTECPG